MDDFFGVERNMQESQGHERDEMEVEHKPPIDFFSRDNEVNTVNNEPDHYIDFFAQENLADQVVDQPVEQSHTSFIDFFAQDDQTNGVADQTNGVADQHAEQSIMYYDFFNIDHQQNAEANVVEQSAWIASYYDLVNQQRAGANVVEQSVQDMDNSAPENQLVAAATGDEQVVPDIEYTALANPLNAASNAVEQSAGNIDYNGLENHSQNIDYYAPENHQLSAAANVVEQSVQDNGTENHQPSVVANVVEQSVQDNAPENQLNAADNVGDQLVREIDFIGVANHLKAAADVFEQSVGGNIDHYALQHYLRNIVYYDPENHRLGVVANMVEQSVQNTDHYALANQPSGAGAANYVAGQSVREFDYIAVANELRAAANALEQSAQDLDYVDLDNMPTEQSDLNSRVMEDINGEMGINIYQDGLVFHIRYETNEDGGPNDGQTDHGEEFEQIPDDEPPFDEQPASRSVVRNLVSVIFTQESVERDTLACPVCMNEFNVGQMAKKLPCSHYFHEECILSWLNLRNTCPVCRYQLPIADGSDVERAQNGTASPE